MGNKQTMSDEGSMKTQEREFQNRKYAKRSKSITDHIINLREFIDRNFSPVFIPGGAERGHLLQNALAVLVDAPCGETPDLQRIRQSIDGKVILDYACGDGYLGVFLGMLGAQVFGFDLSQEAIEVARLKAQANGVDDHTLFSVMDASNLAYLSGEFDMVLGIEALHHVIFYSNTSCELHRIMKHGGRAVFVENLGHNPVLEWVRDRFTLSATETTLRYPDVRAFGEPFCEIEIHESSLFYMIKRLFRGRFHKCIVRALLSALWCLDRFLLKIFPGLRRFCGESIVVLVK